MSFTQDAVLLERREGLDWQPLGQARFAEGNLSAKLNELRGDQGHGSSDLDTVLVIPDDQILYTRLTASPGADVPSAIGRALEGMTPYKSEDLAFDWCPDDDGRIDSLRVAAVARKTLEEAEEFARVQGFRPSGFVARPGDERFDGQPDFGTSELAQQKRNLPPFSKPDLQQAAVTSGRIEISEPENTQPVISRIPPHYVLPQPVATNGVEIFDLEAKILADEALSGQPEADDSTVGAAAPAVIRHGDRRPDAPAAGLSPRARAIHAKAAEARSRRADADADAPAKAGGLLQRWQNSPPSTLTVMIGLLVAVMLVALFFLGGSPNGDSQIAEAPAPQSEADVAADAAAAEPEQAAPVDPDPQVEAVEPTEADQAATAPAENSQDDSAADGVADETADAAADGSEVAPKDALTAALTEALQDTNAAEQVAANPAPGQSADGASQDAPATPDNQSQPRILEGEAARIASGQAVERAVAEPRAADTAADSSEASSEASVAAEPAAPSTAEPAAQQLSSSARPPRSAPQRTQTPEQSDQRPALPANPQPFEQRTEPAPQRVDGQRPPSRPVAASTTGTAPAAAPAATTQQAAPQPEPSAAPETAASSPSTSSPRPPARPDDLTFLEEGSRSETGSDTRLTRSEQLFLQSLLRDLRTAQAGSTGLSETERGAVIRLAQARPQRRPVSVSGPSQDAVRDAVAEALTSSERPETRSDVADGGSNSNAGSGNASLAGLNRSGRPETRPGSVSTRAESGSDPGSSSLSKDAVDKAIASAVENSTASPGAVALTALTSSAIPPRRGNASPSAPTADDLRSAAQNQEAERNREAALAEQRREDAALQAQAEARARERAAADARAEAQARAAAEARARAQAEAEARAAAARQQQYTPPEAEKEPEGARQTPSGRTPSSVAAAATVKDGIKVNRTQIIGTIGAGKASRALVRLSNGKIITLRLGDKINGGKITEIGNSRITYVEGGRTKQLSVLSGQ